MEAADTGDLGSQILVGAGGVAMVVGAVDPLEGLLVILAGSGLVTLGTWLGKSDRRLLVSWLWLFGLIRFCLVSSRCLR